MNNKMFILDIDDTYNCALCRHEERVNADDRK